MKITRLFCRLTVATFVLVQSFGMHANMYLGSVQQALAMTAEDFDLSLEKVLLGDEPLPGGKVQYQITYQNIIGTEVTGASIVDTYSAGLSNPVVVTSDAIGATYTHDIDAKTLTRDNFTIAANDVHTIVVEFDVDATLQDGDVVSNYAGAQGCNEECVSQEFTNVEGASITVAGTPFVPPVVYDLELTKQEGICDSAGCTQNPGTYTEVGQTVYYTLTYTNNSSVTVDNVVIVDQSDLDLDFVGATAPTAWGDPLYNSSNHTLSYSNGVSLAPGETGEIVLEYTLHAIYKSVIPNSAMIGIITDPVHLGYPLTYDDFGQPEYPSTMVPKVSTETDTSNNNSTVTIATPPRDLGLMKSIVGTTPTTAGDVVTYRLEFWNDGPASDSIGISDIMSYETYSVVNTVLGISIDPSISVGLIEGNVNLSPEVYYPGIETNELYFYDMSVPAMTQNDPPKRIEITVKINEMCSTDMLKNKAKITFTRNYFTPSGVFTKELIDQDGTNGNFNLDEDTNEDPQNNEDNPKSTNEDSIDTPIDAGGIECGTSGTDYDLIINSKTANVTEAQVGDIITYTYEIINEGNSGKYVYLDDDLPVEMSVTNLLYDETRFKTVDETPIMMGALSTIYDQFTTNNTILDGFDSAEEFASLECIDLLGDPNYGPNILMNQLNADFAVDFDTQLQLSLSSGQGIQTSFMEAYSYAYEQMYLTMVAATWDPIQYKADVYDCYFDAIVELVLSGGQSITHALNRASYLANAFAEPLSTAVGLLSPMNNIGDPYLILSDFTTAFAAVERPTPDATIVSSLSSSQDVYDYVFSTISSSSLLQYVELSLIDYDRVTGPTMNINPDVMSGDILVLQDYEAQLFDADGGYVGTHHYINLEDYLNDMDTTTCYYLDGMSYCLLNTTGDYGIIYNSTYTTDATYPLYEFRYDEDNFNDVTGSTTTTLGANQDGLNYLPPYTVETYSFQAVVESSATCGTSLENTGTIALCNLASTCADGDFDYSSEIVPGGNNSATESIDIICADPYDVSIVESVETNHPANTTEDQFCEPGDVIIFSLEICNELTVAQSDIVVDYNYAPGLTFLYSVNDPSGDFSHDAASNNMTWEGVNLAGGACTTVDVNFQTSPTLACSYTNESSVGLETSPGVYNFVGDEDITNNDSDATVMPITPVSSTPSSGKSSGAFAPVAGGTSVTFTLTYTNNAPTAGVLNISDLYDTYGLTFVSETSGQLTNNATTGELSATGISLAAGATFSSDVTFTVNSVEAGYVANNNVEYTLVLTEECNCTLDQDYTNNSDTVPFTIASGPAYDLALVKVLSGSTTNFTSGDDVTFVVTVTNQGEADANNFTITDYFPAGLTLNDTDWSNISPTSGIGAGTSDYTYNGTLAASGGTVDIPITFTVNGAMTGTITNRAEISADDGDDSDSTPDTTNGTTTESPTDNTILNESGDEDDHDPASITVLDPVVPNYDLALIKQLQGTTTSFLAGDDVTFDITVTNQGEVVANTFTITDYFPTGLTLNDTDWSNDGTLGAGTTDYTYNGTLATGASTTIPITFTVNGAMTGTIINRAEISADDGNDTDSTPDTTNGTTTESPTDDTIDNESGDEDDHDPASITVSDTPFYDLALTKVLSGTQTVFQAGDVVTFDITVYNQGTIDAQSFTITDYIPSGLSLDDTAWTTTNSIGPSTAMYTGGPLVAGSNTVIPVTFVLNGDALGDLTNRAEISADDGDDSDSTPDTTNDTTTESPTDDTIDNESGDEDDHDPASITVVEFDLALDKVLTSSAEAEPGSTVTFDITVYNQGTVDAANVVITDYVPAGLTLADSNWTTNGQIGPGIITYPLGSLAAGSNQTISVSFVADSNQFGQIINWSEISAADPVDVNGDILTGISDIDSTPDADQFNSDGETNDLDDDNIINEDGFDVANDGDEDDHDPAIVTVGNIFDLALTKVLSGSEYVEVGDVVTFDIYVENQGGVDAQNIVISDYFPVGLTLSDSNWTNNGVGPSTAEYVLGALDAGDNTTISITFVVNADTTGQITNRAEISGADPVDENGDIIASGFSSTDIDSIPDAIEGDFDAVSTYTGDDVYGSDNNLAGNGTDDEDDHDPAQIFIAEMDLALTKLYDSYIDNDANGTLTVGDDVIFAITLYNQGNVDATNIVVTDYVPAGLMVQDPNRTNNGVDGATSSSYTYTSVLDAGNDETFTITLRVNGDEYGEITNRSEISGFDTLDDGGNMVTGLVDIDSTPDTDKNNDIQPSGDGDVTDNTVDQDGLNGGDEDDHDPAAVTLGLFDLALTKHLVDESPYRPGDVVTFDIVLYNQGTIDATDIVVTDYIPAGLTLTGSDWTQTNGVAQTTYTDTLPAMSNGVVSTGSVSISFVIDTTTIGQIVNRSEITSSTDLDGNTIPDVDSTPDDDQFSGDGETDDLDDDDIIDNTNGDEDDHDPAVLTVLPTYDLALTKINTIPGPNTVVYPGDQVQFEIEVFNQGNSTATDIQITDYIPTGLTLDDTDWSLEPNGNATYSSIASLASAASDTVTIDFVVNQYFSGQAMNRAEISDFSGSDGSDVDDRDSTPDDTNFNQDGETDDQNNDNDIDNEDGDEDDHDPAGVYGEVYDLALIKTMVPGSPYAFGSGDRIEFLITVTNQGTLTGSVTSLVDHFPAGITLDDSNWDTNGTAGDATATYNGGPIGPLAPGASTGVVIEFYSNGSVTGNVVNWAEIAGDDSAIYGTTDTDSTPDGFNFSQDGEIDDLKDDDTNNEDGKNGGDEDDHDPEQITLDYFDLALTKTINTSANPGPYYPGSLITFDVEVTNQGTVASNDFTVTDYVPQGLTLSDTNWTSVDATEAQIKYTDGLAEGDSVIIPITFVVDDHVLGDITNRAEISSDDGAYLGGDWDSDPDTTNDTILESPTDNTIDNESGDEDDHDPAQITIDPYYDLALVKYLTTATVVEPGDIAMFEIKVINQGNIVANNVELTDYIPEGLMLADNNWTDNGNGAVLYNIPVGPINPGSSEVITINLQVDQFVNDLDGQIINRAEIGADNGDSYGGDVDSMPDDINHNQSGEEMNLEDDGIVNEDGKNGGDEDDHDPAVLPIGDVYDLALIKTVNTSTNTGPYYPGSLVTFDIAVTNQGNMPAAQIEVTDYLPAEMMLMDNNWTDNGDGTAIYNNQLDLLPSESETITITLLIHQHILGDVINRAEISNDDGVDVDSKEDDQKNNDVYDDTDDVVDNQNGDEDDHDPATIRVEPRYDLALDKKYNGTTQIITDGEMVTFDITIHNQGNIAAENIEITDYIPNGLILSDAQWNLLADGTARINNIDVLAGETLVVPITFEAVADAAGDVVRNRAEISIDNSATFGGDVDSMADDIQFDGNGETDDLEDDNIIAQDGKNGGDEDDHDVAEVIMLKPSVGGGDSRPVASPVPVPVISTPVVEESEITIEVLVDTENTIVEQKILDLKNEEIPKYVSHTSASNQGYALEIDMGIRLPAALPQTGAY